jgi:hypothetical protein
MFAEFLFQIGDEVTLRSMCSPFLAEQSRALLTNEVLMPPFPQKMQVVGRIAEECVGGVQRHYKVRIYSVGERRMTTGSEVAVGRDLFTFGEFELVAWADVLADRDPKKDV